MKQIYENGRRVLTTGAILASLYFGVPNNLYAELRDSSNAELRKQEVGLERDCNCTNFFLPGLGLGLSLGAVAIGLANSKRR